MDGYTDVLFIQQPSGITSYHCLPPTPSCFSLKPCLYAVRKMVQYGGGEAGHLVHQICIWPQHMANPGHLTIVLIRTCRHTGCCTFTVSVSFFSQHVDLVLIIRTHLPFLSKSLPPLLSPRISSAIPSSFLFTFNWPAAFKLEGWSYSTDPTESINKPHSRQKVTTAAQGLQRGWGAYASFLNALRKIVYFFSDSGVIKFAQKKEKPTYPRSPDFRLGFTSQTQESQRECDPTHNPGKQNKTTSSWNDWDWISLQMPVSCSFMFCIG